MDELTKLRHDILNATSIGIGLAGLLSALMAEHARVLGGDPEAAMARTREVVERTLIGLSAKGTSAQGESKDISLEVQDRVRQMLEAADSRARRQLGLGSTPRRHH